MGIALALALAAFTAAHVAIAVGFAQGGQWRQALLALLVPPLAPWWGWRAGMRARTLVWGAMLALYALGVMQA
jgi:hypothetical protein